MKFADLSLPSSDSYATLRGFLREILSNPVVMLTIGATVIRGYEVNKWICPGIPLGVLIVYLLLPLVRSCAMIVAGTVIEGGRSIGSVLWVLLAPMSCIIRLSNLISATLLGREVYSPAWLLVSWCLAERSGCNDPDRSIFNGRILISYSGILISY